jgi:glutamate-5-semialdehyde dehydrogenase
MKQLAQKAKQASFEAMNLSQDDRKRIVLAMADSLESSRAIILEENKKDLGLATELSDAMRDRLTLNDSRFAAMVKGLRDLVELDDKIGSEIESRKRPNGLKISKIRVPIGVIGIIYESRPNVTADAGGLCIRTSNAVILRGGKESLNSNRAIVQALIKGGLSAGMPDGMLSFVDSADRDSVRELVTQEGLVDLIIPRGGEGLIRAVTDMSKVPVLKHYKGVCHVYVDKAARLDLAEKIIINAKCQRPGVCNAMETLLVHQDLAPSFLPKLAATLRELNVEIRGDEQTQKLLPFALPVQDWSTEYLDLILAVRVVDSEQQAIEHINKFGSGHTDAIVSEDVKALEIFQRGVDTGVVMLNASTRFNDGQSLDLVLKLVLALISFTLEAQWE